jgi:DMSO reductase family type II enzyme heme b subunit
VVDTKRTEDQVGMQARQQGRRWRIAVLVAVGIVLGGVGVAPTQAQPSEADLAAGKRLYDERCAHCHGEEGDGQGSAAEVVYPAPRDFTSGVYKFRSRHETADGNKLPADEDLFRSIKEGLHGTSMPGWAGFFSDPQIWQLVHYIKTFSAIFTEDKPGAPLDFSGEVPFSEESAAKGKELFEEEFDCDSCHGTAGRGNGPQALEGLDDDWGKRIWPANLTKPWTYRGGHSRRDIFRNIALGIAGTPMPVFADPDPMAYARQIENRDERQEEEAFARQVRENIWHTVNYVQSLWTYPVEPEAKSVLTAKRVEGPLPLSPDDVAWQGVPANYYPLVGQVIEGERLFTPMVVGIEVQALHNGEEVALRLVWDDRTESKPGGVERGEETYADAVALQFPSQSSAGPEKPYFLMGDASHSTDLWYWRNDTGTTVLVQTAGYKTFQPGDNPGGIESQGVVDNGQYRVVMQRALHTANAEQEVQFTEGSFIPISMTVWDGSNGERGGDRRTVTAWYNLYLEPEPSKTPLYLTLVGIAVGLVIEFSALYVTRKNHTNATS